MPINRNQLGKHTNTEAHDIEGRSLEFVAQATGEKNGNSEVTFSVS